MIVYSIQNTQNGKRYIGSTVNFPGRKRVHLWMLRHNRHHSILLQRSWNKYGEDCFKFEILFESEDSKIQIQMEQKFMDELKPELNICPVAGVRSGFSHSDECKKRISIKVKQMCADGEISRPDRTGYKQSEETKAKIGAAHKGRVFSDTTLEKMRLAKRAKAHPLTIQNIDTGEIFVFSSKHEASSTLKIDRKELSKAVQQNTPIKRFRVVA